MTYHAILNLTLVAFVGCGGSTAEIDGDPTPRIDGISLTPAFRGKPTPTQQFFLSGHTASQRQIRFGDWKIVKLKNVKGWEIYNVKDDPSELNNLAAKMPEKVAALTEQYTKWKADRRVGDFNTKSDTTKDE